MAERKRDWEIITGWEKRIAVDFGSIGPNHVRWSDWTHKERDIVARKVHESTLISDQYGPRSRQLADWAKENEPIMIDFARDGKPMIDWAHADFRESGVPDYVDVVWKRDDPNDMTSHGDWAYDPPGPWNNKGAEPAWSSRPMDTAYDPNDEYTPPVGMDTGGGMHSKFGGVISYRTASNGDYVATDGTVISTAESRAQEDVPQWRKFELGRLEIVDNVVIPGPNALAKDIEQYGENVKLTNRHKVEQTQTQQSPGRNPDRIMPDDPNYTSLEKALSWAKEEQHGPQHQARWSKVAAALGADNGYPPMPLNEAEGLWERFNRNRRWTMAINAIEKMESNDIAAANRYRQAVGLPPVEKSQSDKLHDALVNVNQRDDVVVKEFNAETKTLDEIQPRGSSGPKPQYRLSPMADYGDIAPNPGATGWYTREAKWLPKWYWDLPEMTFDEGEAAGMTSRASVAPLHYIFHKAGFGILGRQKASAEREDLPIWTKTQADEYYRNKGIKMRSITWLDGHLMTRKGYTDTGDGHGTPVARAASEEYEEAHKSVPVPNEMADAIAAGDWAEVARLAQERA